MTHTIIAANQQLNNLFGGTIAPPPGMSSFGGDAYGGLLKFLNVGLSLVLVVAGLFTLFNIIIAGFTYMTAGGDSKKVSEAQNKMLFTAIGLGIIVAAPVIAGIIGLIVFGNWRAILSPDIIDINGNAL
jgi:hypothetical protein